MITINEHFMNTFSMIQQKVHQTAVEHGWWEDNRSDAECIALMHSELSEALEGLRDGNPKSVKAEGFTNVEEEFADCIIRIMDLAEHRGYNIAGAIISKIEYNKSRPYKHGRQF